MDETGIYLTPTVLRTWGAVGETPVVRHHGPRKKASLIGALTCRADASQCDILIHGYPDQSIDTDKVLHFLQCLHQMVPGRVIVFWDNAKIHRNNRTRDFVQENQDWLETVPFPPYAPELNPIEFLWALWKGSSLAGYCHSNLEQVRTLVEQACENTTQDQMLMQSCLIGAGLFTQCEIATE